MHMLFIDNPPHQISLLELGSKECCVIQVHTVHKTHFPRPPPGQSFAETRREMGRRVTPGILECRVWTVSTAAVYDLLVGMLGNDRTGLTLVWGTKGVAFDSGYSDYGI